MTKFTPCSLIIIVLLLAFSVECYSPGNLPPPPSPPHSLHSTLVLQPICYTLYWRMLFVGYDKRYEMNERGFAGDSLSGEYKLLQNFQKFCYLKLSYSYPIGGFGDFSTMKRSNIRY